MHPTSTLGPAPAFRPGDRVQVTAAGVFAGMVGEVAAPAPEFPAAVMVRLRAGNRPIEIGFHRGHLQPAPADPAGAAR